MYLKTGEWKKVLLSKVGTIKESQTQNRQPEKYFRSHFRFTNLFSGPKFVPQLNLKAESSEREMPSIMASGAHTPPGWDFILASWEPVISPEIALIKKQG